MMETEREDPGRKLMALVLNGTGTPEETRRQAWKAKRKLTEDFYALWRNILLIDQIVQNYAPDPGWLLGWVTDIPQTAGVLHTPGPAADRTARVLAIASELVNRGSKTATAKVIAQRLRLEGDETPEKDLATSAGNILARSPRFWRRIRPGEYEPVGVQPNQL